MYRTREKLLRAKLLAARSSLISHSALYFIANVCAIQSLKPSLRSSCHSRQLATTLRILHNSRLQTLGVLNVHGLHIRVQLLLRTLLVVTLARYPYAETEWDALDAGFPDLLVELWVEADV
jgi:hypothetical protein